MKVEHQECVGSEPILYKIFPIYAIFLPKNSTDLTSFMIIGSFFLGYLKKISYLCIT